MSDPKLFGAEGDGVRDDTNAIQHAIDDGDGTLDFPKGTFLISKTITIDTTKTGFTGIHGRMGATRIVMTGEGPAFHILGNHQGTADPNSVKDHTWEKERFPLVQGIEIHGQNPKADGIHLHRTMQTTVQNVLIRQCRHGVRLYKRNRNFLLANSHIYDGHETGVFFDNCNLHQVIIVGNHISYCKKAGIYQHNGDVHNIQITGNDIEYNSGADAPSGDILLEIPDEGVVSEYTIASNTIQATLDAAGSNIWIRGRESEGVFAVRAINITGNVLGSRNENLVIEYGNRVTVTGNTIYGGTERNLRLDHCHNMVVGSNTINSRPSGYPADTSDGVLLLDCIGLNLNSNVLIDHKAGSEASGGAVTLERCSDCRISQNQILDSKHRGIHLIDSSACALSDNSIRGGEKKESYQAGIEVSGGSAQNLVQNNLVSQGVHGGILVPEGTGQVQGNMPG
ncbi:MAG: right-handed parallel beta-helix repeat-containing protein [Candidatus Omnitrophica bacterium]|nr:right-handed parallel beta-helix repeat-containing protein [Candidatus Omnitrophota bacterium]